MRGIIIASAAVLLSGCASSEHAEHCVARTGGGSVCLTAIVAGAEGSPLNTFRPVLSGSCVTVYDERKLILADSCQTFVNGAPGTEIFRSAIEGGAVAGAAALLPATRIDQQGGGATSMTTAQLNQQALVSAQATAQASAVASAQRTGAHKQRGRGRKG